MTNPLPGCLASLLTKHLLFVGFSMVDDNFNKLFDAVRKTCTDVSLQGQKLGTVVSIEDKKLAAEMWDELLEVRPAPRSLACAGSAATAVVGAFGSP